MKEKEEGAADLKAGFVGTATSVVRVIREFHDFDS